MTQMEIAEQLKINQSTVSDDVKALREASQRFIFDLAKSDLGYFYKECIDGIDDVTREAWKLYDVMTSGLVEPKNVKVALEALKIVIQAKEAKHKLLTEGPNILTVKAMEDRLQQIEQSFIKEANR
jgi:DNA-binding Lrp family transcriptional regulator